MTAPYPNDILLVTGCLLFIVFLYFRNQKGSTNPLPPGPTMFPLIGSLLSFPTSFEWETFDRWAKEYNSDILHCRAPGTSLIILNSFKTANDLLDKRSAIYSNRPDFTLIGRVMGLQWLMPFIAYGAEWRERRRLFQRHMSPANSGRFKTIQLEYTRRLLVHLLDAPDAFDQHIRHSIGGILHSIAYGTKTSAFDDPYVAIAEEVTGHLSDTAIPASTVFDAMPFFIPLLSPFLSVTPFNKTKKEWRELASRFRDDPFVSAQNSVINGLSGPSLVTSALEAGTNLTEEQANVVKDTAGVIFIGGAGTTTVILQTFVLAMLCFPDVQAKAQKELDEVIGSNRLPEFDDEPHLPYLGAVIKEVQRWRPVGPLAIPHRVDKDDIYDGYLVPAKSIIIANVWSILHDTTEYPDPERFDPERFLKDGQPDLSVRDPATVGFGFGRRLCPGAHIALATFWISAASILSAFDITKPTDNKGKVIEPTMEYHSAVTFAPLPFKCNLQPRSKVAEALIRAQADL